MKNREIEFRGLRKDGGGWVYGDLLHDYWILGDTFLKTAIRYKINNAYSYPIEVIPETVGQYTGLKDKNGVKMFEWDIYIHNRRKFVIVFTENCGIVSVEVNNNLGSILHDRISTANHNRRDYMDIYGISKYIEVIDNIHEKKEI